MPAMNKRNTFLKRFKVTPTGKILHRKMGQGHFRAKKSSKQIRGKRGTSSYAPSVAKLLQKVL
ncbi:MAG: 50S ribosomal protein L35 [bacterium]|nr:50S ribosomal protein L35 [bacterium]